MRTRALALAIGTALVMGCNAVTVRPEGSVRLTSEPTVSEMQHFYLWGLVNENHVDVTQVCGGRKVVQMQARDEFVDRILSLITIGIYAPRHARIWCE